MYAWYVCTPNILREAFELEYAVVTPSAATVVDMPSLIPPHGLVMVTLAAESMVVLEGENEMFACGLMIVIDVDEKRARYG